MKIVMPLIAMLVVSVSSVHAQKRISYEMGFKTLTVFEYKKYLKKEGEDIPKFPPRTGNALIVRFVEEDSRAENAGLRSSDLIRILDGKLIRSANEAVKTLQNITYKDELKLGILRPKGEKWERITLTLEPMTESEYLNSVLTRNFQVDHDFNPCYMIRHADAPFSRYSHKNIQLYYSEVDERAKTLYLRLGIFVRGKGNEGNIVVQTDRTKYKVELGQEIDEQEVDERKKALDKKMKDAEEQYNVLVKKSKESAAKTQAAEAAHLAKFKGFKLDKNRKDKQYENMRKQYRDSLKNIESLAKVSAEDAKNVFMSVQRRKEYLADATDYMKKKLKRQREIQRLRSERVTAAFNRLDPYDKKSLARTADLVAQGIMPNNSQLDSMEFHGIYSPTVDDLKAAQGWKWYDAPLKKTQTKMIEDIISSNKVMVYYEDMPQQPFELTSVKKKHMQLVLRSFEQSGGTLPK